MKERGLTLIEIKGKKFKEKFGGYDKRDVDDFMKKIIEEFERVTRENNELKEEVSKLKEEVSRIKSLEEEIKNTLILANKTAKEVKFNAKREADLILKEAKLEADRIIKDTRERVEKLDEYFLTFRNQFKLYLQTFMNLINELEKTKIESET